MRFQTILQEKNRTMVRRMTRFLSENHVFQLGDFYYKFPNFPAFFFWSGCDHYAQMRRNIAIVHQYFARDFRIAETRLYRYRDKYYLRQRVIPAQNVSLELIEQNARLRFKLRRLMSINEHLWRKTGRYLDMVGSDGFFDSSRLHNLLWDGENIIIFDFGLLDSASPNPVYAGISTAFYELQRAFIMQFLRNIGAENEASVVGRRPRQRIRNAVKPRARR